MKKIYKKKLVKEQAKEDIDRFERILSRISRNDNIFELTSGNLDEFINGGGERLIFFLDNPIKRREVVDLAVLIPDLSKLTGREVKSGFLREEFSKDLITKYAINFLPAILFLRNGGYLGVISGLKNWGEYQELISEIINLEVSNLPKKTINIQTIN